MVTNKWNREVKYRTKDEAIEAVRKNWTDLEYIADELFDNREVMVEAVQQNGLFLQCASEGLKNDKDVVLQAVQKWGGTLQYASEGLKNDREVVLQAVQRSGFALQFASEGLKNDKDVVLQAVRKNWKVLEYASEGLKNDKDVVLQAFQQDPDALQYASPGLKSDKAFMLEAVQEWGGALQFASEGLKNDRDVVLQAFRQDTRALDCASPGLKSDKDFMLEAAKHNVNESLKHADWRVKTDRAFFVEAVRIDPTALRYAAKELLGDLDFLVEACAAEPRCLDYVEGTLKERIREDSEAVAKIGKDLEENATKLDKECKFYFMPRETFLAQRTWPKYQDMEKAFELVEESIRLADGVRGKYANHILSISHCWETATMPDPTGIQLKTVQEYLKENTNIKLVWGDFSSMPQGDRTPREKMEFKRMLPRINLLYLSTSVLQIVDISYPSRFWTQFESWLAMQRCTRTGLRGADRCKARYTIKCIHSAKDGFEGAKLEDTWLNATADVAYDVLSADDVRVTNLSDKEAQLPKIKILNQAVIEAFKEPSELPDPVEEPDQEVEKVPEKTEFDKLKEENQSLKEKIQPLKMLAERLMHKNHSLEQDNETLHKEITMLRESVGGKALPAVPTAKNEVVHMTEDSPPLVLRGWLQKRGPCAMYGWKPMWCVLRSGKLECFMTDDCKEKKLEIQLPASARAVAFTAAEAPGDAIKHRQEIQHGFVLDRHPDGDASRRLFYFDPGSQERLRQWTRALEEAAGGDDACEKLAG